MPKFHNKGVKRKWIPKRNNRKSRIFWLQMPEGREESERVEVYEISKATTRQTASSWSSVLTHHKEEQEEEKEGKMVKRRKQKEGEEGRKQARKAKRRTEMGWFQENFGLRERERESRRRRRTTTTKYYWISWSRIFVGEVDQKANWEWECLRVSAREMGRRVSV